MEELRLGGSIKQIALRLGISPNTLKERFKAIYAKVEVHSARELLVKMYVEPRRKTEAASLPWLRALEQILDAEHWLAALEALQIAARTHLLCRAEVFALRGDARLWRLHPLTATAAAAAGAGPAPKRAATAGGADDLPPPVWCGASDLISAALARGELESALAPPLLPNWRLPLRLFRIPCGDGRYALLILSAADADDLRQARMLARFCEAVLNRAPGPTLVPAPAGRPAK